MPRSRSCGLAWIALLSLAACGPSGGGTGSSLGSGVVGGEQFNIEVDPNKGGKASALQIMEIRWGRLVDVYDSEDSDNNPQTPVVRNLILRDYLIGQEIISDGSNYLLETSPFTEQTELTVFADSDSEDLVAGTLETQSDRFDRLLMTATINLGFVPPIGLGSSFLPPFPLIPRNSAMSIRLSDLLDHASVNGQTVRVLTGTPAAIPFGARIFPDPNFGALIEVSGQLAFHSTRILIDFTVSETESQGTPAPINPIGLPPSTTNLLTNAIIRIPTQTDAATGQFTVVRNVAGHALDFANNGPTDSTLTSDIIRTFRTGRSDDDSSNTDPNNGFLLDIDAPRILGSQAITLAASPAVLLPNELEGDAPGDQVFLLDFHFDTIACAQTARAGNIIRMRGSLFGDLFAEVTRQSSPPVTGTSSDVRVRLLPIPAGANIQDLRDDFLLATTGEFQSIFEPGPGVQPSCFFEISPTPGLPPADLISTQPQITVRFSEPMNPETITPHENFRIDRLSAGTPGPNPYQSIVGQIGVSTDLRAFRFSPLSPIDHIASTESSDKDQLFLTVEGGLSGVTDLAGNSLEDALPPDIRLTIDPAEPTVRSGGIVLSFEKIDEDGNTSALNPDLLIPEIRGQFLRDLDRGVILAREVTRESRVIDRSVPIISIMPTTGAPIITPLVPLGSRMMTVWRYVDVGFSILDENTSNVDVEGLNYAPFGGAVSTDFFDQFEISLAHSAFLPDEWKIPISQGAGGYAQFDKSGLDKTYAKNVLDDPLNSLIVVHERSKGYLLTPTQVFTSGSGSLMMPYPLNRGGEPISEFEYFTWRDTAVLGKGGAKGFGAEIKALITVGALCQTKNPTVYPSSEVRSLGLPLLMDFKCFQDDLAGGLNGLDTSFAIPTQRFPAFRIFSSGGFNETGSPIAINPDGETVGSGGFNGATGAKLAVSDDNTVMLGQLDFVVRVSRVHSIWFDTLAVAGTGTTTFLTPVVEPRPDQQPDGTSVILAFRGATGIITADGLDQSNGLLYDAYGDPLVIRTVTGNGCPLPTDVDQLILEPSDFEPVFLNGDGTWHANIGDLDGARFIQARITFISNSATGFRAELSTLAIPYLL